MSFKVIFILQLEGTFLTVQRFNLKTGNWTTIATDADWDTRFFIILVLSAIIQKNCKVEI